MTLVTHTDDDHTPDAGPDRASPSDARGLPPLTTVEWLVCIVGALGFAFDLYEMLVMPVVLRPALMDIGGLVPGSREFNRWVALMFYVPAMAGGAFGLLGAWLTDVCGRRRILTWSILLYSCAALGSAFASTPLQLLLFRCLTVIGVSVEYVAAVAWLAELFSAPGRRDRVLGYTQSAAGLGGLMASGAYYLAVTHAESLPAIAGGHDAWRYVFLFGLAPALLLALVRPFLPESPAWRAGHARIVRRPQFRELFRVPLRRTTIVTTVLMACAYGLVSGVLQQTPRVVPGLAEVRELTPRAIEQAVGRVQFTGELGVIAGRLLFAFLVVRVVQQRRLIALFLVPALPLIPLIYLRASTLSIATLGAAVFIVALLINGPFSQLWNYLPRVYPSRLRGTGEGFTHNVGGRWLGAFAPVLTTQLANVVPGVSAATRLAHAVAITAVVLLTIALLASRALPEPVGDALPA